MDTHPGLEEEVAVSEFMASHSECVMHLFELLIYYSVIKIFTVGPLFISRSQSKLEPGLWKLLESRIWKLWQLWLQ